VVNAIYHRSYEIREPIEILISSEDLVVLSFPGPDRSIQLADLKKGKAVSRRYRNRQIGEFLKELDPHRRPLDRNFKDHQSHGGEWLPGPGI